MITKKASAEVMRTQQSRLKYDGGYQSRAGVTSEKHLRLSIATRIDVDMHCIGPHHLLAGIRFVSDRGI